MNAPLYNKLIEYSNKKYPFHMPGHKFGKFGDMNELNLTGLDATEASGLDNLYESEEVIQEAMTYMAEFYGSKDTIFLTNGSTAGILASILTVCRPGDKLLVAKNCHHSVWSALVLSGVIPIYISPSYREEGIIGEIEVTSIEEAMNKYPEVKGAIIVSPTYEGIVSDIKTIAKCLHKEKKVLIVDEAHGAHFVLSEAFPKSSIEEGADLVIHSMHKTLPTLTQSALLHIVSPNIKKEDIISSLKMIQTSSPSYMMMGLMDYMREYLITHQVQINKNYITPLLEIREELKNLKYLSLLDEDKDKYDKSKIIILTHTANISGYELAKILEDEYNLGVEAAAEGSIILMSTVADDKKRLVFLKDALLEIDKNLSAGKVKVQPYQYITREGILGKCPRDIYFNPKKWVNIKECIGQICGKNVMLYPPGIPIICIGEKIKEYHLEVVQLVKDKALGIKIEEEQIQLYIEDKICELD